MTKTDLPLFLFSIKEVSQASKLGTSKIYELIRSKKLAVIKCGRRTLVRLCDFEAFIEGLATKEGGAK